MNAEAVVVEILRAAGVADGAVFAERVAATGPFCLVTANGGPTRSSASTGRYITADIAIDVWAATKAEARQHIDTAAAALRNYPRTDPVRAGAVLVSSNVPEPTYTPDPDRMADGNPSPRYTTTARVTVRPT